MKRFYLILIISVVITLSSGLSPGEKKKILEDCEKIHKTGYNTDEIIDKWLIPESYKGKCLMECFAFKKGLIDEQANINHKTATLLFKRSFPNDCESISKAEAALKKCDALDLCKLDHCSRGVEILKCFRKNAKELGLNH